MKKFTSMVLTIGLGSALVLAGCSSSDSKVSDGVNNMLETTEQLSKAIESGDQAKVKVRSAGMFSIRLNSPPAKFWIQIPFASSG